MTGNALAKKFKNTSYDLKDSDEFKRNCTFECQIVNHIQCHGIKPDNICIVAA